MPTSENQRPHFELKEYGGLFYPVVKRKKGTFTIEECPYCSEKHMHAIGLGHRIAKCTSNYVSEISIDGKTIPQTRGYYIVEY